MKIILCWFGYHNWEWLGEFIINDMWYDKFICMRCGKIGVSVVGRHE